MNPIGNFGNVSKAVAVILVTSLMLVQLISPLGAQEVPKYGGTLIIGIRGDPPTFNQGLSTSMYTHLMGSELFDTLIVFDLDWNPQPELAESWEISDDGLTYTFHLRQNVTWHDGEPFTAEDVKWNLEELYYTYHPTGKLAFQCIESIDTPDAYTVVLNLEYQFPALMAYLSPWSMQPMPKHIYEGTDILTNPHNLDNPIGTGPFKFEEYVKGDHITFVRNPNYWKKGKPYLDKVIYKILPDPASMSLAFEKGEVDVLTPIDVPLERVSELQEMSGVEVVLQPPSPKAYQSLHFIFINLQRPPLDNVLVRQALSYAIDKEATNDLAAFGLYKVASSPIPSGMTWCYNPDVPKYEYDPVKAEELLDQAGFPKGTDGMRFKITLTYNSDHGGVTSASAMIREYFRDVGIDCELRPLDEASCMEYTNRLYDFDLSWTGSFGAAPEPAVSVARIYHSEYYQPGMWNCFPYNSSRVDELFDLASKEANTEKRGEYYKEIQEIICEDAPAIYMWETTHIWAYHDKWVEGSGPFGRRIPPDLHWYAGYDYLQWEEGSEVSPESAASDVESAETKIENLKGQFYDVTEALTLLEDAKEKLEAGDYATASSLAKQAIAACIPPYWLYATIVGIIVAVLVVGYWYIRRRRKT